MYLAEYCTTITMTPTSVASFSFLCLLVLLLPPQHGAFSSHASNKLGSSRQFFSKTTGKSSGNVNSQQATTVPPATDCSSIANGLLGNNKLPVVHRHSPCSPLHGLPSLTVADVLRRDVSRIRRRLTTICAGCLNTTTIPVNSSSDLPGLMDYSVLASYGTPEQQFPMFLDTGGITGASLVRCKPCASSGSNKCDPRAFDTSRSSTFARVLCGSPDCPSNCSAAVGSGCLFDDPYSRIKGTFAQDVLTLAPSMAIHNFSFVCFDLEDLPEAGMTLDLSRGRNSLPSQLTSSMGLASQAPAATFSYCLPQSPTSQGFLSLGFYDNVKDENVTAHAPLVSNKGETMLARMYFIDLVGMSLGGEDLQISSRSFGNHGTNLDVGITFTTLPPDAYTPLRDSFRKHMSQYNRSVPGFAGFDTCFNFTGLNELTLPLVRFKFSNGESLLIDGHQQMLYYDDPAAGPFTMACLAFSSLESDGPAFSSVIGTYTLASTEVVYDVARKMVGFIPHSC